MTSKKPFAQHEFIPLLCNSSIFERSKCVHRQAETNKPSSLWMHVQRLDIRLVSWTSNQVSGPVWSRAKSNFLWLLWRSTAVTNKNHRHHHWLSCQPGNKYSWTRASTNASRHRWASTEWITSIQLLSFRASNDCCQVFECPNFLYCKLQYTHHWFYWSIYTSEYCSPHGKNV